MRLTDTGKLIAAFFIGLAVALGAVFLYARVNRPSGPDVAVAAKAPAMGVAEPAWKKAPLDDQVAAPSTTASPKAASSKAVSQVVQPRIASRTAKHVSARAPVTSAPETKPAPEAVPAPNTIASNTIVQNTPPPASSQSSSQFGPPAAAPAYNPGPAGNSAPASQAPPTPHVVTLPVGTGLNVRLLETVSTESISTGDSFDASLTSPVISDGFVIVDKGARVKGKVVQADRSGRVKGRASLVLELTEINTTDGQHLPVRTDTFVREAASGTGKDAAKVAGGAALGAIIGALAGGGKGAAVGAGAGGAAGTGVVLGTRGKPVVLASETPLTFRLSTPVTITEQLRN